MSVPRYTVLGGGGFIGGALVAALRMSGASCDAPKRDDAELFDRDLGTVFYCIGLTGDFRDRPFATAEAHVSLLARVLDRASFDRLVCLSSVRVYDRGAEGDEEARLVFDASDPADLYTLSKALGENLCLTASGGRARVARLSNVYGDSPAATGFLPDLLRRLAATPRLAVEGETGTVRDYVHIDDAVRGLIAFSREDSAGVINIASGENISNGEIVAMLNSRGCELALRQTTALQQRPAIDIARLRRLGVEPRSLREFLANAPLAHP